MSGSLTRSAWLFLITVVTITYRSAGEPSQLIVCGQPNVFTVQIAGKEHVVYGSKLLIRHSPQVEIFSYPGIEPVNVVFNETVIEFKGYMSRQRSATDDLLPERFCWNASGTIFGIGMLQKVNNENYAVQECRLFLPADIKSSANLPKEVKETIISYAQSCVKENLCQRIETMTTKELGENINTYDERGHVPNISHPTNVTRKFELIVNVPVDIVLKNAVRYIKEAGHSIIKLPDIHETYNVGFGINCRFEMFNGTFEDFSTLMRTEDAFMSNVGKTNVIEAGVGLSTTELNYEYKMAIGLINVNGKILGTVKGLAMAARVIIYYDETCDVNLEYIKVTELGKINFKITGLGPLNSFTSTILTWLTRMWQYRIIKVVEINMKDIAEKQLNNYLCNYYMNEIMKS